MTTYFNASGEVREIDDDLYAGWVAAGNPKAQGWTLRPDMPAFDAKNQQCAWVDGKWVVTDIPVVVPESVTMRQARLALLGAGKLALVDAAIDGMPEPQKSAARIEWEYSNEVQRHNSFVSALGPALGMTSAQIDQLFIAASKL
jgi:hypothetical protein